MPKPLHPNGYSSPPQPFPRRGIVFQRSTVCGGNDALGREGAGGRTARNASGSDECGHRSLIFILTHLLPPPVIGAGRLKAPVRLSREPPLSLAGWRSCDWRSVRAGERVLARHCSPLPLAADPVWSPETQLLGGKRVSHPVAHRRRTRSSERR